MRYPLVQVRIGLYIRGEDLGMFVQILGERVTGPPADAFHSLKRDTPEQVFEGSAYADAVAVFHGAAHLFECPFQAGKEDGLGEQPMCGAMPVGK